MSFEELEKKARQALSEINNNGLDHAGYGVQIELSIKSYYELQAQRRYFAIKTEVDDLKEPVHKGTIFGIPFVLTKYTDRVLIAKEIN